MHLLFTNSNAIIVTENNVKHFHLLLKTVMRILLQKLRGEGTKPRFFGDRINFLYIALNLSKGTLIWRSNEVADAIRAEVMGDQMWASTRPQNFKMAPC